MRILLFAILALVQLGVPLSMVARYESVLAFGNEYKFQCAPVDPVDHLRGRYVALGFRTPIPASADYSRVSAIKIQIKKDADGFALLSILPNGATPEGEIIDCSSRWGRVQLPFDKYFMNENQAPEAEAAYRSAVRRSVQNPQTGVWSPDCYLVVKIWKGYAVGSSLVINGKPVEELLREKKH